MIITTAPYEGKAVRDLVESRCENTGVCHNNVWQPDWRDMTSGVVRKEAFSKPSSSSSSSMRLLLTFFRSPFFLLRVPAITAHPHVHLPTTPSPLSVANARIKHLFTELVDFPVGFGKSSTRTARSLPESLGANVGGCETGFRSSPTHLRITHLMFECSVSEERQVANALKTGYSLASLPCLVVQKCQKCHTIEQIAVTCELPCIDFWA